MSRLCDAALAGLPASVSRPGYDRGAVATGIVHLGIGAFHRAHQAVLADDVLRAGDLRWGILGASLRSPATRDALAPQDGLYTLNVRAEQDAFRVVGSVTGVRVAAEDPAALVQAMARPEVRIVGLTVTEKGYCLDPATGELDSAHPDIAHDLADPGRPRSAVGMLAAAAALRKAGGAGPFTALSCDNLAGNGAALRRVLLAFARRIDAGLADWIEARVAFPDTMVDRIVPATEPADRLRVNTALGLEDAWPVVAEPFLQWVVQDSFAAGRPEWEAHGATLVAEVAPFEAMKLRLLNASHSALAYMGLRRGHATVAEAVADPALAAFARALMQDAAETLVLPAGTDVAAYQRALMERFANPALRHRLAQIAMDGSQKLPPRLLAPMRERLARGLPVTRHAAAVAAWMRHVAGGTDVSDPLAPELRRLARDGGPARLLQCMPVFGEPGAELARAVLHALETEEPDAKRP